MDTDVRARRRLGFGGLLVCVCGLLFLSALAAQPAPAAVGDQRAIELADSISGTFQISYAVSSPPWRSFMPSTAAGRRQIFDWQSELGRLVQGDELSTSARTHVYNVMWDQIWRYPDLMRKSRRDTGAPIYLPQILYPGAARARAMVHATIRNTFEYPRTGTVADEMGLWGARRALYLDQGVLTLDNNSLSETQVNRALDMWQNMPGFLPRPPAFSIIAELGAVGSEWAHFIGDFGGFNWLNIASGSQDQFPSDFDSYTIPVYCSGLQHEANHIVDGRYVQTQPALEARKQALITRAGSDPLNYLRSMYVDTEDVDGDGNRTESLFPINRGEFVASISNQYLASTEHTFELALQRFRAGRPEPLNQFLFFAEIYSGGGNNTRAITQDANCDYTSENAPLERDIYGHIKSITLNGLKTEFTLDTQGNVTAIKSGWVSVNGFGQLVYDASPRERNNVSVWRQGQDVMLTDTGASPRAWPTACRRIYWPGTVACHASEVKSILVRTHDKDDTVKNMTDLPLRAYGGPGTDTLEGSSGNDQLSGEGGHDTLRGYGGVDWLDGGDDGDILDGGAGANIDVIYGGADGSADTVDYSKRGQGVTVDLSDPAPDGAPGEQDYLVNVQDVTGGSGGDVLIGDGNSNGLYGGDGKDRLEGRGGGRNTLLGGAGDDVLVPGPATDWMSGGTDNDTIDFSKHTADIDFDLTKPLRIQGVDDILLALDVENLTGGSGNDRLTGDDKDNTLIGGLGDDRLAGGAGIDTVDYSGVSARVHVSLNDLADDGYNEQTDNVLSDVENVIGGSGDDDLQGDADANRLEGRGGEDEIYGNGGDDVLIGGTGSDIELNGGAGTDTLSYEDHVASQPVTVDLHNLTGNGAPSLLESDLVRNFENVTGGNGDDHLTGDDGSNVLRGGPGEDVLDGGLGADRLNGGTDTDTTVYTSRAEGVTVTIADNGENLPGNDGQGCPGVSCEGDNVTTDNVIGGAGPDFIVGSATANVLVGCSGNDILIGAAGRDTLTDGLAPFCSGAGSEQIDAIDGEADTVDCGSESTDRFRADPIDSVTGCEIEF